MGIRAVSGAIVAVLVLSFVPPSQAEEPPDATSLDVYADQHGCVMADQLVIHFDDGTTQVSEPDCVTADEAMPAEDGSNAGSKATKEPVFWFTSGRPNFVRSDLQGRFTAQRTMTEGYPVAMSYRIAPALRAIATSPAVTVFTRSRKNCRYEKVAPVGYFFHWSCRDHLLQRIYTIRGSLVFSVSVGGRPGTADIDVIYRYAHAAV